VRVGWGRAKVGRVLQAASEAAIESSVKLTFKVEGKKNE